MKSEHSLENQEEVENSRVDIPHPYSDNIYQEGYISQFLSISSSQPKMKENEQDEFQSDYSEFFRPHSEGEMRKSAIKSVFHNFQKHLVIFLRHTISLHLEFKDSITGQLERKIWDFFLHCPKMTRTLLHIVYGGIDMDSPDGRNILKEYGFSPIIKSEEKERVLLAQKSLRQHTLRHAAMINLDWELGKRRMKNKGDFRVYFQTFLEELQEGVVHKRAKKEEKQKSEHTQSF